MGRNHIENTMSEESTDVFQRAANAGGILTTSREINIGDNNATSERVDLCFLMRKKTCEYGCCETGITNADNTPEVMSL